MKISLHVLGTFFRIKGRDHETKCVGAGGECQRQYSRNKHEAFASERVKLEGNLEI